MNNPISVATCFGHPARRTNGFSRRDAGSTLIPGAKLTSRRDVRQSAVRRTFIPLCLLLAALCLTALGQNSIDWYTIDGGGGTSTGGAYSVSGTIGQPDAGGPMTGGQFSLTGGFWALPTAVQTPGAPTLTITPATPGFATVSWMPASGTNWVLQQAAAVTGAWTNSPSTWTNPVTVPATVPSRFYRLFKP